MFANKLAVVTIALVAEVCAAGGPNFLTLCIHEDGTVRYEPTMALCCKQDERGKGECCSHEDGDAGERDGIDADDACQDFGVFFSQVSVTRPSIRQFLLDGSVLSELLPIVAFLPESPFARESAAFDCCGPPRDRILLELSTVVLRI